MFAAQIVMHSTDTAHGFCGQLASLHGMADELLLLDRPNVRLSDLGLPLRPMSSLNIPIAIGIGGFIGALLRFYIAGFIARSAGDEFSFLGTMAVNLIGCLAIGVLMTIAARPGLLSPIMQKCLLTGLLGSLTTFSTFAMESLNLMQAGHFGAAVLNMSVNLFAGLILVWLGMLLAGTLMADSSPIN